MKRIKFFLTKMFGQQKIGAEKGFTLAEIMVTAGIVAVLAVAIMRMNNMAQKTAKSTAQSLEITQLVGHAQRLLSDPISCEATLKTKVPTAGGLPIAKIVRGARVGGVTTVEKEEIGAGTNCIANTLRPTSTSPQKCISGTGTSGRIGLYKMLVKKLDAVANGPSSGVLELHITKGAAADDNWDILSAAEKAAINKIQADSSYGSAVTVKSIPISFVLVGGAVTTCYTAEENHAQKACEDLGGNYNGTLTPVCALPIPNAADCIDVALTAIGSVNYNAITVGTNAQSCPDGRVLHGVGLTTTAVGGADAAVFDGTTINFSRITLTLKCCRTNKPAR